MRKPLTCGQELLNVRTDTYIERYEFMKKTYQYQVVKEEKQKNNHMLYLIRYKAANGGISEQWIGVTKLRRYYQQDKLTGSFSEHVKEVLEAETKKPVSKLKYKLTPRMEGDGPVYLNKYKWNLPDEFKVEQGPVATGKAYIFEKDGRWCVMMPDGTIDEYTYPDKEWAQSEADSLNEVVEENKQ